jgi:hypothetical protein
MPVLPLLALLASFHVDYATYLGGSIDDLVRATTVDSTGNLYVIGSTDSPNFPLTSTAYGAPSQNNGCAFVTKLNPSATAVVWSICLTGMISEAIALDATGDVYVLVYDATGISSIIKFAPGADHMIYSKSHGRCRRIRVCRGLGGRGIRHYAWSLPTQPRSGNMWLRF